MSKRFTELSRLVSYALRHCPWEFELELNSEGWVSVEQLLSALRMDPVWRYLTRHDLEMMIFANKKRRHELVGDRIRALYGHSVPIKISTEPNTPPDVLYHGTARSTFSNIQKEGLLPKGRQFVHLSVTKEIALQVGRRKDSDPIILVVDTIGALASGVLFYQANEQIFLTKHIPGVFIRILR